MKVAICIPHNGSTKALFTDSLGKLLLHSGRTFEIELLMAGSSDIAGNRETLAARALEIRADWLLWLDTDQVFPADTLARLLARNEPVIGCNYGRRGNPTGPTAGRFENGVEIPIWTDQDRARRGVIEQVHYMGLGVCLISTETLRSLDRPWFKMDPHEDVYFFAKLLQKRVRFYVDHALSWEIGHVGDRVISNADTIRDRERWVAGS